MRVRGRILTGLCIGVVFAGPDFTRAQDATSTNLPERIEPGEAAPQPATHKKKKTRRSRRAVMRASSEPPVGEAGRTAATQQAAPRSTPTQKKARVKKPPPSAVQREIVGPSVPAQLSLSAAQALAVSAPLPEYPYEAKHANATGSGVCIMIVDTASGKVTSATMAQSTGNAVLDKVTVETFRRWQFRPGSVTEIRVPISYE
jgi:TonB family protein